MSDDLISFKSLEIDVAAEAERIETEIRDIVWRKPPETSNTTPRRRRM